MTQSYTQPLARTIDGRSPAARTLSARDHARTAATAILDALLPTKRRHRRKPHHNSPSSLPHFFPSSVPSLLHPASAPAAPVDTLHHLASSTPHQTLLPEYFSSDSVSITRLGHSSMLIRFFGTTILTDPVLSDRVGIELFGKTIGIDRYTAPILTFEEIPTPDIILLSHAHFDHTDLPTLRRFAAAYPDNITVICAKNTQDVLDGLAWKNVIELDWDEEICAHDVKISALEVLHNGWRCPWERDRANGYTASGRSYNAYLLEKKERRLLFGGDTAFTTRFDELRHCVIDVAMMPIGAYQDYESLHCTPEQALQMATTMNAAYFLPMHFGAFLQSNEAPEEPLQRLTSAASLYSSRVAAAQCGETFTLLPASKR